MSNRRYAVASSALQILANGSVNCAISPGVVWASSEDDAKAKAKQYIREKCPESQGWAAHQSDAMEIQDPPQAG